MKKLKYLVLLLAAMLVMPFTVFAEGEEYEDEPVVTSEEGADEADSRVKVYFFYGNGCPHCAEAEEWFTSIEEEYGDRYVIEDYETWYDTDNNDLMKQVAESRGEYDESNFGVPYIIIGDKSWMGFSEDTMADEIKAQIDQVYAQPVSERHDSLAGVGSGAEGGEEEKSTGSDVVGLIIILVVVGGLGFGIYKSRQSAK